MNLEQLTAQEIFDKVVERLRDGTGQAQRTNKDGLTNCVYDNGYGHCCAVGIFLTSPDLKSFIGDVQDMNAATLGTPQERDFLTENEPLLLSLQFTHDTGGYWEDGDFTDLGENQLQVIARNHDLEYTPPEASA